jgi:putative ABC transport system substrate-binding protein
LVSQKVDVIVTNGTPGCLAAKRATSTIPIVMAAVGDPVRSGLVASLARPGGNITGLSLQVFELDIKRTALLKEVAPTVSRVAFLGVPGTQPADVTESARREQDGAAKTMGIQLMPFGVRGLDDYERAYSTMASVPRVLSPRKSRPPA